MKKYIAEMIGTFVLTLFGCGAAAISGGITGPLSILGIAAAFGLSIVAMAYAIGDVSGCHINPAVSLGVFFAGKMSGKDCVMYIIFQCIGGILAVATLLAIISCSGLSVATSGLGANGFGSASYTNLSCGGAVLVEIILTCVFVMTILGVTSNEKYSANAGIIIGLTLMFVHILGIPLTGTSVNPARSLGPALMLAFTGNTLALSQLWVFLLAPAIGGILAAVIWKYLVKPVQEAK